MKFWLYFFGTFFLAVTLQMLKHQQLDLAAFGFSVLAALTVAIMWTIQNTMTKPKTNIPTEN